MLRNQITFPIKAKDLFENVKVGDFYPVLETQMSGKGLHWVIINYNPRCDTFIEKWKTLRF